MHIIMSEVSKLCLKSTYIENKRPHMVTIMEIYFMSSIAILITLVYNMCLKYLTMM